MIWDTKLAPSLSWVLLFATPWTVTHQAPLFLGFSRQEYWSGLPFPSPGDLHDPGMELQSPALAGIHCTTWEADPILNDSCCKVLPHYKLEVVVTEEYFLAVQIKKGNYYFYPFLVVLLVAWGFTGFTSFNMKK